MDAVHKAAFRGRLGRSLYMKPDRVGSYSVKAVRSLLLLYCTCIVALFVNQKFLAWLNRKVLQSPQRRMIENNCDVLVLVTVGLVCQQVLRYRECSINWHWRRPVSAVRADQKVDHAK